MSNDDQFYILSLPWTREDTLTWWSPNNSGYTSILEHAGRYSREQVTARPDYYNNGESTIAVPCSDVDAVAKRVVFGDFLGKLTGKRFKRVMSESDLCDQCGQDTPNPICIGLEVTSDIGKR